MTASKPADELSLRYREACAQDSRRPGERVRAAVRAHAAMVIGAKQTDLPGSAMEKPPAANQARWKLSLLASICLLGLTSLLVLQFDRGTPQEQAIGLGRPSVSTSPAPATMAPPLQSPAVEQALGGDSQSTRDARRKPRAVAALEAKPTQPKMPILGPERSGQALTARRESPVPSSSGLPSPTTGSAPAVIPLSAQLADAATAGPANSGAVAQSGAGATSTRSALRAAKAIPTPLASLAPQQRLDNAEQATQSTEKESPRVMDLTPALQASARAGQVAQVEHLLRQGALINAPDEAGRTPLILATINGHTRLVARLLALGANPALTDHDDLTALQHARRLRHWQIADLLGG